MMVCKQSDVTTYIMQVYFAFIEDKVYVRFKDNNTWKSWLELDTTAMVDYGTATTNYKTRENLLSCMTDKTIQKFVHCFTSEEIPGGASTENSHISTVKRFSSTWGVIETYNVNTGKRFVSTKTSGTWSKWISLTNVLPYERNISGKTRAELFALVEESENDSKMFTTTFASSDLPPSCTTSNRFGVYIYKNNSTYGSIIAIKGSGDAEIFKSDLTNGTWGNWVEITTGNRAVAGEVSCSGPTTLTQIVNAIGIKQGKKNSAIVLLTSIPVDLRPVSTMTVAYCISIVRSTDMMLQWINVQTGEIFTNVNYGGGWKGWAKNLTDRYNELTSLDLNTVKKNGTYYANGCTNRPTSNNGIVVCGIDSASSYGIQLYFSFTVETTWVRFCRGSSGWQSWKQLQYV